MRNHFNRRQFTFVVALCASLAGAAALPFVVASCRTQTRGDEPAAFDRLRSLTRGGASPSEATVAQLASEHAGTRAGALALVLQARLRAASNNFAGAASLLSSRDIKSQTAIGDYALWLRADALEKTGRKVEARAALEELVRDYPDSLRAREAALRAAQLLAQDGQGAGVPLALKRLADADDRDALLLTAKAYEQAGDSLRALAAYRRLYFHANGTVTTDGEATAAFSRLSSTNAPATAEEATTRAEKLFQSKRYAEAVGAYEDAFGRFTATATPESRLRRGIAAFHARRAPETISSLTAVPTSAGETRAEALHYLAQHYARARQWDVARSTLSEMLRAFPQSDWTKRAAAAAGIAARDAKNNFEATSFYRLAVESFPGEPEVAGAQFELAWAAHEAKRLEESSRLLIEHLASYADRNT
ncbi:MAG TPA: tetratricopeptide repeat protein, partial [Pyrinomonadaceae bacterium]|nr:tetratricopeptide repeat protein [Pyrinomonadaceae bacterium]